MNRRDWEVSTDGLGIGSFAEDRALRTLDQRVEMDQVSQWDWKSYLKGYAAMDQLIDAANVIGGDKALALGMLDAFTGSHRTLQQSTVGAIITMLRQWTKGQECAFVDGRNECAWKWAKQATKDEPYMPTI